MKLYIVKYCANEYDDLEYESPYLIYCSLDENKARNFFEMNRAEKIDNFNNYISEHPKLQNDENYCIEKNSTDELEYSMGKWFYHYVFDEVELEKDLRYN